MKLSGETPAPRLPAQRLRIALRGAVQGVGFRPFVYRLATELRLAGWVNNSTHGVLLEVEGEASLLEQFRFRLEAEKPPRTLIQNLEASWLDLAGYRGFEIRPSYYGGAKTALVLPDIATCPDCLREIFDPDNRRSGYPFTNCTHCGPRFSIIEALPYDRANTSMKHFRMCPACQAEYDDPRDRRFHAQPNACPACGPELELWDRKGHTIFGGRHRRENVPDSSPEKNHPSSLPCGHQALVGAAEAIRQKQIVAVKGLGGFHLMVDSRSDSAVTRLRELKHREEKPFALMFPSLESVKQACQVSGLEECLLRSAEAPMVLLRRKPSAICHLPFAISTSVAPANPYLGVMLPHTPLHHLLLAALGFPVVATSGNLSDEPICTDEHEALARLGGIADLFLVHNRPIVRQVDDSIARIVLGRELVLRRGRGYAPLPVQLRSVPADDAPVLAVGAHLKNSVALSVGNQIFISQHVGDLETELALAAFRRVVGDLQQLYGARPAIVAADAHPDYLSSKFARESGAPVVNVQHHYAHVLSCMAENELAPPVLGVAWDGAGYGLDGTIWGGEFLMISKTFFQRAGHLRPFRLPGGDKAAREPRRAALGLLYEMFGEAVFAMNELAPVGAFSTAELKTLATMQSANVNTPVTSSVGRLFDAVAALIGLRQATRFEGQAAMDLEFVLEGVATDEVYALPMADGQWPMGKTAWTNNPSTICQLPSAFLLDWSPMIHQIIADLKLGVSAGEISAKFHNTLVEAIVVIARHVGEPRVALTGGCFQNKYLLERAVQGLQAAGFRPYWHQRVPPNDGGIALGQAVAAACHAVAGK
jgi:hydrogenase maturation protein HypF